MKRNINEIILFGAVWGFIEATLGYVLHSIPLKVGWFFWFPLAYFFLDKVYKHTNSYTAVLYTSSIAAAIKLINLLMPTRLDRVLNPAMSIILEGLAVFTVFILANRSKTFSKHKLLSTLTASFGWRILYIIYIFHMPSFFWEVSPMRAIEPFVKFFFTESITNSIIIYAYIKLTEIIEKKAAGKEPAKESKLKIILSYVDNHKALKTSVTLSLLALAFFVQWVL